VVSANERDNFDYSFFLREYARQQELKHKPRIADGETVRKLDALEAEGKGIWATVKEIAIIGKVTRETVRRDIMRGKFTVKKMPDKRNASGYRYLIWINDQKRVREILSIRNMQIVEINITDFNMLLLLKKKAKIDADAIKHFLRTGKASLQIIIPNKTLQEVLESVAIQPNITVAMDTPDCHTVAMDTPDCHTVAMDTPDCHTVAMDTPDCTSFSLLAKTPARQQVKNKPEEDL